MSFIYRFFLFFVVICAPTFGLANTKKPKILPASTVFFPKISSIKDNIINVDIDIKPKYYIYRQRLFSISSDNIKIIKTTLSQGTTKYDQFFGKQSVWYGGENKARILIEYKSTNNIKNISLNLKYQGCEEDIICYPPQNIILKANIPINEKTSQSITNKKQPPLWASNKKRGYKNLILGKRNNNEVLDENKAFPFNVSFFDKNTISIQWQMPNGYYLYKNKIKISGKFVSKFQLSQGIDHYDKFFGKQIIYRKNNAIAKIYLKKELKIGDSLDIQFQGCADVGICYPVMSHRISLLEDNSFSVTPIDNSSFKNIKKTNKTSLVQEINAVDKLSKALKTNIWLGISILFVAGLALSFTPCVLPMLPILLGITSRQKETTRAKSFVLSASYTLGIAFMMSIFGLIVAKTGINLQIIFQEPLLLVFFAAIFITMSFAMFGLFNIQIPSCLQSRIYKLQNKLNNAKAHSLFIMGALSTLVVGPCVAPPLIAILAFISTTNNSFGGAAYLFALGLGMGVPLVIFATASSSIPKTGAFSLLIKNILASLMLGVGLWILSRLLPGPVSMVIWGVFMAFVSIFFWKNFLIKKWAKFISKGFAIILLFVGLSWLYGGFIGNSNPFNPYKKVIKLNFKYINNTTELENIINGDNKPIMLDLYADWCVSCQEIEHITFADPDVIAELERFTIIKIDITNMNNDNRKLIEKLGLIGPPAILFFKNGKEIKEMRHIGVIDAKEILKKLKVAEKYK